MEPIDRALPQPLRQLSDDRHLPRVTEARRVRLLLALLAWVVVIGANTLTGLFPVPIAAHLLLFGAILNELLARLLFRHPRWRSIGWTLTALLESILLAFTFYFLGGSNSPLLPLFLVQILTTSLLANGFLGLMIAMLDLVLVTGVMLAELFGVVQQWPVVPRAGMVGAEDTLRIVRYFVWGGTLLLTAYVGGYVATLLRQGEQASLTRENRELAALRRISRAISTEQPLDEIIAMILIGVKEVLNLEQSPVYLVAPESAEGTLRLFASTDADRRLLTRLFGAPPEETALPPLREARRRVAELVGDEPLYFLYDLAELTEAMGLPISPVQATDVQRRRGTQGYVLAPLYAEGTLVGLLVVSLARNTLQAEEERSLQMMAGEAGRAIYLAHLRQARDSLTQTLQLRNAQLARILALSNELRLELPDSDLLQRVVDGVQGTLGMELVVLSVLEGEALRTAAWSGRTEQLPPPILTQINRTLLRRENQISRSFVLREGDGPPLRPGDEWTEGDRLIVPLEVMGRILGYVSIGGQPGTEVPPLSMVETLEIMAGQAGLALQNARLFQEVADERSRLNAMLAASIEPIIALNAAGEVVLINTAAAKALDLSINQALGRRLDGAPFPRALRALAPSAETPASSHTDEMALDDERVFAVAIAPWFGNRRTLRGWVITMHDITHFRRLDQLKSEFVGTVSHDLRAPLTAISGFAFLLDRQPLSVEGREALDQIQEAVKRMNRLITDLLDLGRIESGIGFEIRPLDPATLLKAVSAEMQPVAQAKGLTLRLFLEERLPLVSGDTDRLHQALVNLVQNAIKFTPSGGEVALRAERLTGQLAIVVSDTGPGIPANQQPYIFDQFFRVGQRDQAARQAEGSGLGLAIVKRIVEQHRGRIELQSAVNRGTSVRILLPTL